LEPYEGDHGTLADGSCIPFYGIIELPGSVRDRTIQETFIIGQLQEDAILGMPFLQRHGCRIDFGKSAILMGDKELSCVDKFGRPLVGEEPIVRSCTMPGHSRGAVHRKVDSGHTSRMGVVESTHPSVPPARSFNQLTRRGKTSVPCFHLPSQMVNLPPTPILSCTPSVQEGDSRPSRETAMRSPRESPPLGQSTASPHTPHSPGTRGRESDGCVDNGECQDTAKL